MEPDLPTFAREAAACGSDLYTLLEIDALASESDIRRAFRKKALTAHPDKTGDAYDPVYYRRLERTRDVLLDADARKLYDDGMRAVHEKRQRLSQMDARRRRLVEELEAAENAAKRAKQQQPRAEERDPEWEAMAAKGRKIMEERRRMMREAEEREAAREREAERERERDKREAEKEQAEKKQDEVKTSQAPKEPMAAETEDDYDQRIAELEQRLRESQQRKAEKKAKKAKKAKDPSPQPPHDPPSPRAEADELKQPSETTPTTIPVRPSAPPSAPADAGKGRFASTMARLRAAQAEKEKRQREEAAKVSAGPAEA